MKILYCVIGFCKERTEQRMKTFLSERHATQIEQTETRIQMINGKRIQTHRLHFPRPNPMQICACAWIYRWTVKKLWKIRLGHRAVGPSWTVGRGPLEYVGICLDTSSVRVYSTVASKGVNALI